MVMGIYALIMHKMAPRRRTAPPIRSPRPHLSATHVVRGALDADATEIHELVAHHAEAGLVLPRSADEIAAAIDDYVVVTDRNGRVLACAALLEYSPSLAEVSSVVVSPEAQGQGLGSMVVRGVEASARRRDIDELFAVTLADGFFSSLGYERCAIARYPEKLARYEALARRGVQVVPKSCFRKLASWS